jgi:ornithine--oxo-acid transaminase
LGRTGKLMGYEWDGVKPDIVTLGKAISGGVTPVSGIVAQAAVMDTIKAGDHGSTYGGNPLGMAAASAAISAIIDEGMIENSAKMGALFKSKIEELNCPLIKEIRGRGLFVGVEFKHELPVDGNDFARILRDGGILSKSTHRHCVRFSPALVIEEHEILEAIDVIKHSLIQMEKLND